jgi:hypothetical protein
MNEVVDRILNSYELMRPLSAERVADSRQKVSRDLGNERDGTPISDNCFFGLLAKNESPGI